MYWIEAVICYGGMFPFVSSHSNTVARVRQSVNMSWSINQAFTDFKIYSTTYHKEKHKLNDSTVQFIVRGNQLLPATINTHTENGTRIQLSLNTSLEGRNLVSLTFRSVDVQDAGVYSIGTHSSDLSRETQLLIVLQKPSEPSISTTVADPVSGDPVNLTCSTTSRSLPLDRSLYQYTLNTSYTWRRNNRSVDRSVDDRVHVAGQFLAIDHVTKEDKGVYTCQSGEEGLLSDWSQGYTLNVLYGPDKIQFDDTSDKLEVEEGKPAAVRCSTDCNPACTVTWWNVSRQTVITGQGEAVLSIPAVDVSVSGLFTCHVNNSHGSASRNLTLDIQLGAALNHSSLQSKSQLANVPFEFIFFLDGLEPRPSTVGVAVPVAVVPSVLIIIITAVAVICVCKRVKKGDRQHRSGARNMEDNESHIQLQPRRKCMRQLEIHETKMFQFLYTSLVQYPVVRVTTN
ncbi:hemicentin-2-like [Haliotis rubra]|uniref:hemicentin-2-like n=1 Tax=Haliotis rubra TaxID=36100 RepID=UPI001EE56686|nr:hemicentin-2-like [Haliotis rubra]